MKTFRSCLLVRETGGMKSCLGAAYRMKPFIEQTCSDSEYYYDGFSN